MSRDFADWHNSLMHYGISKKKSDLYGRKAAENLANKQNQRTKQLIADKQASNKRAQAISPTGNLKPGIYNSKLGSYEKDKQFIKEHGIAPYKPAKKTTAKNMVSNINPQDIINKRRGKLLRK